MKATVEYYDIDTDTGVMKNCFCFTYDTKEDYFAFTPVDDPPTIYKSVIVNSPRVDMRYSMYGLKVVVEGWMMTKSGGYCKNKVVIKIENEKEYKQFTY